MTIHIFNPQTIVDLAFSTIAACLSVSTISAVAAFWTINAIDYLRNN